MTTISSPTYTVGIDTVTESQWSELLARFDDATIYQSWAYGAICWAGSQLSHLVLNNAGKEVAIAQVRIVRVPGIGKGVAYVRWGPLCRLRGEGWSEEVLRQTLLALKEEYVERRGLLLRIVPNAYAEEPLADSWKSACEALGFRPDPSVHVYRTMRVDLSGSLEDLRKGLHQRWRNYLKNAEKSGFTVVEGSAPELYQTFLVLYRQMMARKQFDTTVDVEEFAHLQEALATPLKMQIFVCQKNGAALNALVVSAIGDSPIYLLAATGDEGLKERGAHLLQWRALQWLKERGCRWYDVGGINPDKNPGVYQFKSGLGGGEVHQLGGYELSNDWVNSLVVGCGERLRTVVQSFRALRV
jgi:hypothetical protein